MNIFSIQVFVSTYYSLLVETRSSWGKGYSWARAKKAQDEPESPEGKKYSRNDRDMAKGHRSQLDGPHWPNWGLFIMKINNDKIDC